MEKGLFLFAGMRPDGTARALRAPLVQKVPFFCRVVSCSPFHGYRCSLFLVPGALFPWGQGPTLMAAPFHLWGARARYSAICEFAIMTARHHLAPGHKHMTPIPSKDIRTSAHRSHGRQHTSKRQTPLQSFQVKDRKI